MGGRQWAGPVQGHNAPDRSGAARPGRQGKVQGGGRKLHWRGILKMIIRKMKDRISTTKSFVMDMIVFLLVLNLLVVMVMLIIPVHKI